MASRACRLVCGRFADFSGLPHGRRRGVGERRRGQGNSMGTFSMPLTEVPGVSLGGTLESGPFSGDSIAGIAGTVSQMYTGGPTCGVAVGKKKVKKVNEGTFTGSAMTIS